MLERIGAVVAQIEISNEEKTMVVLRQQVLRQSGRKSQLIGFIGQLLDRRLHIRCSECGEQEVEINDDDYMECCTCHTQYKRQIRDDVDEIKSLPIVFMLIPCEDGAYFSVLPEKGTGKFASDKRLHDFQDELALLGRHRTKKKNAREVTVTNGVPMWREESDIVYFSLISDGTTGPSWIRRFEKNKRRLSDYAKIALRSHEFAETSGVVYDIAISRRMVFKDSYLSMQGICSKACETGYEIPSLEVACLMYNMLPDKELKQMGFSQIIVMHKPIEVSFGNLRMLTLSAGLLSASDGDLHGRTNHTCGFAFVCSRVA